ncbi:hypothetical protein FQN53_008537 [Emmonsiellopsis sp. PD_33]|nr:hypothetical protein FQN53_008537 [Emmonsiellopsis sp. PD_33]
MISVDEEYWCWVNLRQAIHASVRTNGDSTTADGDDEDGLVTADLEPLWENGTGLCTSFTIFVALELNRTHGHEFKLADNGCHRAAYSSVDSRHIIVDSSARCLMTTDGTNAVRGFKGEWRVKGGLESKIGSSKAYVPFTDLASFADGMRICLRQMAKDGTHITLFRNVHGGRARFNGRVQIEFERRLIKWGYPKGGQFQVCPATYTGQGTARGEEHFRMRFLGFAHQSSRQEQFEQIRSVLTSIMGTFTEVHGYSEITQYTE